MDGEKHWAIEKFENKFDREEPFINQYIGGIAGAAIGVGAVCYGNFTMRRPVWAGVQKHIMVGVAVGAFFEWARRRANRYYAERDAVLRDYIRLHPKDFPQPERKKVGELLLPWIPIR